MHDKRKDTLARDLVALEAAFGSKKLERRLLGVGALTMLLGRARRGGRRGSAALKTLEETL